MSSMDKQDYEEMYGEKVIYCSVHNASGIDGCVACEEEERMDIPEEDWVSECCASKPIGELDISKFGVTGRCGKCEDLVGFEPPW